MTTVLIIVVVLMLFGGGGYYGYLGAGSKGSQQPNPSTAAPSRDYVKSHKVIFCKARGE